MGTPVQIHQPGKVLTNIYPGQASVVCHEPLILVQILLRPFGSQTEEIAQEEVQKSPVRNDENTIIRLSVLGAEKFENPADARRDIGVQFVWTVPPPRVVEVVRQYQPGKVFGEESAIRPGQPDFFVIFHIPFIDPTPLVEVGASVDGHVQPFGDDVGSFGGAAHQAGIDVREAKPLAIVGVVLIDGRVGVGLGDMFGNGAGLLAAEFGQWNIRVAMRLARVGFPTGIVFRLGVT